jgi:hypothetical protein
MTRWYARAAQSQALKAVSWQESNRIFLTTYIGLLAVVYVFILLVDPYDVVPFSLPFERPITNSAQQMFPQILRTGRYDSIVVGTSTSQLLDPAALGRVLGARFANFALPGATAWEQVRIIDYFRRTVAAPKAILVGIDHEWCYRDVSAIVKRIATAKEKNFPAWAYDESRWNDLLYLLNVPTLEAAGRAVTDVATHVRGRVRDDGFEIFTPSESAYDLARARDKIYGDSGRDLVAAYAHAPESPAAMQFPALPWLDERLASLPEGTRKFLAFLPVHAHVLPETGSPREAREGECKSRVAAIARRRGATLVDWRIVSPLSLEDSNFWDPLHYRLPIGGRLIDDLDHIVHEGSESPDGDYRILVR